MITEMTKALHRIKIGQIQAAQELRELHSAAKSAQTNLRELVTLIEQSAIEHIEATGQDIELNDGKRWRCYETHHRRFWRTRIFTMEARRSQATDR